MVDSTHNAVVMKLLEFHIIREQDCMKRTVDKH